MFYEALEVVGSMGNRRWKKRGQGSQRKDAEFPTLVQIVDRQLPSSVPSFTSVPEWEKRFCSQMKWRDFCDKKRVVHLFPKVLEWDDSAGKEAFDNAKARFWAEINNLPSEIPLPDPNMYIQEVDYDAYIDPSLIEDFYRCAELDPSPTDNLPEITADGIVDSSSVPIRPTGWGDDDDQNSRISVAAEPITIIPTGWGDEKNTEPIDAWDSQARPLNGAYVLNDEKNVESMFGTAENHGRGWKQDGRNDNKLSSEPVDSWERHEHRNGAPRGRRYRKKGGDRSFSSNQANLRCHEQGYSKDRWTNYNKGQYFWRQKPSLDRGLSCAPGNH